MTISTCTDIEIITVFFVLFSYQVLEVSMHFTPATHPSSDQPPFSYSPSQTQQVQTNFQVPTTVLGFRGPECLD